VSSQIEKVLAELDKELDIPTLRVALGRRELHRNDDVPRVVVIPIGGPIGATQEIGRRDLLTSATRSLYQRELTCEVYCWAGDYEATEQLLHNVVVAMRRVALGSWQPLTERWLSDEEQTSGDVLRGHVAVLEAMLIIPIPDDIVRPLRAPPITITHAGKFSTQTVC